MTKPVHKTTVTILDIPTEVLEELVLSYVDHELAITVPTDTQVTMGYKDGGRAVFRVTLEAPAKQWPPESWGK